MCDVCERNKINDCFVFELQNVSFSTLKCFRAKQIRVLCITEPSFYRVLAGIFDIFSVVRNWSHHNCVNAYKNRNIFSCSVLDSLFTRWQACAVFRFRMFLFWHSWSLWHEQIWKSLFITSKQQHFFACPRAANLTKLLSYPFTYEGPAC